MSELHIYTRVSTAAQEDQGTSLQTQEELGRDAASRLGFSARVWNEGGRSSNHEDLAGRPVLNSLVNEVVAGRVKHIFVYDQSRLSRRDNVASQLRYYFRRHGVTLHTKDGCYDMSDPQDMFMKQVLDAFSELDNSMRAGRTRQGKLQRVRQGQWHGGPPPFGYRLEGKRLTIDAEEANAIREVFAQYASGVPIAQIKGLLDRSGVPPRRKGLWSVGSINALLKNTHYIGYYHFTDKALAESVRIECPPIIAPDTWQAAQEVRKATLLRKGQINRTTHFYLLRDLMYCADCGCPLGARTKPSKGEHFYYCPSKERHWKSQVGTGLATCTLARSMNIVRADALVWEVVTAIHGQSSLLKEEVRTQLLAGVVQTPAERERTERKKEIERRLAKNSLADAENALVSAEVDYRLGKIDQQMFARLQERLQDVRNMSVAQLDAVDRDIRELASERKWVDWVKAFGDDVRAKDSLTPTDRKAYLSGMIERIDVRFLTDTKEHRLDIVFRKPIVGDGIIKLKPSGYRLREGRKVKTVELGASGGKRLTPVGKRSVTVE